MFAGAAFTDEADFDVDTDVVDTLVGLGVLNGYKDGTFRPNDTVTRAEMAKMIYVVRTGKSDARAYNNDATTFTDINNHWGRGYIKYCQSLGIIAGKNATTFAPDQTVTTQEAAKMLLVTLGYNAEKVGLVGKGWGNRTTALADENGLLKDVVCGTTQGMPRQYAAQLIYNAIFAPTVVLRDGEYTNMTLIGDEKLPTIGKKYMGLVEFTAVLEKYNTKNAAVFTNVKLNDKAADVSFNEYKVDRSELIGRGVTILAKEDTRTDKYTIYGIFEDDAFTYIDTIEGDVKSYTNNKTDNDTVKIDGTKYDVAVKSASAAVDNEEVKKVADKKGAAPVVVMLNDDDEVVSITTKRFEVAEVTFVGSKTINAGGSMDVEDVEAYDGIKKNDWVIKTDNEYTNKTALTKADVVEGKITNVKGDEFTIDGVVYTLATDVNGSALDLSNTVKIVVVDGYIYNAEKVSGIASLDEIVYIKGAKVANDYGDLTVKAKATFTDGKTAEIRVVENEAFNGQPARDEAALKGIKDSNSFLDGMWAFSKDGEKYTLKAITDGKDKDFEVKTEVASAGKDKIGGMRVNDDAVVFVQDKDGDVFVKTGKVVKSWAEGTKVSSVLAYGDKTNGVAYVEVGAIVLNGIDVPGASGDAVYGYVTAYNGSSKNEDDKTVYSYTLWTADGEKTVVTDDIVGDLEKSTKDEGKFVKVEGDKLTKLTETAGKLTGMDGDTLFFDDGTTEYYNVADTQIIYISAADKEGVEGGSLQLAEDLNDDTTKEKNVMLVKGDADGSNWEIAALFVDVNNDIENVLGN